MRTHRHLSRGHRPRVRRSASVCWPQSSPAAAATPVAVEIVSHMDFNQEGGFNTGDFEASGPAVDQGLICESGTVEDTRLILAGSRVRVGKIQIPVRKTFTCDDGSGEIFIKIQVHLDLNTQTETFSWVVLGGTGDYSDLRGSGGARPSATAPIRRPETSTTTSVS